MVKLKNMKNPKKCKHTEIAQETIETYNIPQGYDNLMKEGDIDMEKYKEGELQNITRCLECGIELDRCPQF